MGLYIFHMNEQEQPTQLITYTQHFINRSVRGVVYSVWSQYGAICEAIVQVYNGTLQWLHIVDTIRDRSIYMSSL